jgi:hypothetical protein
MNSCEVWPGSIEEPVAELESVKVRGAKVLRM